MPTSRRLVANSIDHHVLEWAASTAEGGGGNPQTTAVALHGFADAGSSWDLVAPLLARAGVRVFAPDLRGYGNSGRVGAGGYYHFPDYVFDVADLIDALSPDAPVFLIGHSMGGTIASMYAGTFPDRVGLLALLEGVGPPSMDEDYAADRVRTWIDGVRAQRTKVERPITREEALRRLAQTHPTVDRGVLRTRVAQLTRPVNGNEDARVWRFDPLHRTTSPIGFSFARWRSHTRKITAPTLVVGGGPTGFHPADEAERLALFAHARAAEIPDAGHMMHWTRPDQLASILVEFVRGSGG